MYSYLFLSADYGDFIDNISVVTWRVERLGAGRYRRRHIVDVGDSKDLLGDDVEGVAIAGNDIILLFDFVGVTVLLVFVLL